MFLNSMYTDSPGNHQTLSHVTYLEISVLAVVAAVAQVEICKLETHHVAWQLLDDESTLPTAASVERGAQGS